MGADNHHKIRMRMNWRRRRSRRESAADDIALGLFGAFLTGVGALVLAYVMSQPSGGQGTRQANTVTDSAPQAVAQGSADSAEPAGKPDIGDSAGVAHPEEWNNPNYAPNESDYDAIANGLHPSDPGQAQDMKDALCAFYQNCQ